MNFDKIVLRPASKKEIINNTIDHIRDLRETGEIDLQLFAKLKRAEQFVKTALAEIKEDVFNMVEDQFSSKEDAIIDGVKFSTYNTGDRIDLMSDDEYARISAEIINREHKYLRKLRQELQHREELLKDAHRMRDKKQNVLTDNGEIVKPPAIKTYGKNAIRVSY